MLNPLSLSFSPLLLFTVLETSRRRIQNPLPLLPHCVLHLFWLRSAADPPHSPKPCGDQTQFPAPPTAGQSPVLTGKENPGQRSGCLSDFQNHWTCCCQSPCPISSLDYGCLWSWPKTLFSLWILYIALQAASSLAVPCDSQAPCPQPHPSPFRPNILSHCRVLGNNEGVL